MTEAPEPRAHVRRPALPWRTGVNLTECGRPAADFARVIDRDEFMAMLRRDGQRRTAYACCITCMDTAERWKTWDESPGDMLYREVYGGRRYERLDDEMRAIAALVAAHREEFDGYMTGLTEVTSLDEVRLARARRQARR